MCHENQEPIHITKNDYRYMDSVVKKVEEGEKDIAQGKCSSGLDFFDELKKNYVDIDSEFNLPSVQAALANHP